MLSLSGFTDLVAMTNSRDCNDNYDLFIGRVNNLILAVGVNINMKDLLRLFVKLFRLFIGKNGRLY